MSHRRVTHEPVHSLRKGQTHPTPHHRHQTHHPHHPKPQTAPVLRATIPANPVPAAATPRPTTVDGLVGQVQTEFPDARIRITGRARTVQRQAELMAERRRANRHQFLSTYRAAPHITEMDTWVTEHPDATADDTNTAFVDIINRARANGATVSNHLSDTARDISIPRGDAAVQSSVRERLQELGGHVLDEHDAVGGPHWHVDF